MRRYFLLLILLSIFLEACSQRTVKLSVHGSTVCGSNRFKKIFEYPPPDRIKEIFQNPSLQQFSKKSLELAIAYNFYEDLLLLKKMEAAQFNPASPNIEVQLQKQKILQSILFAQSDIYATESELRCYEDRFSEIINELKESENEIVRNNSFIAILVGGIGTLLDGATADQFELNRFVIVTSGTLITYFSYLAYEPIVVVDFKPKSTVLKDLGTNPTISGSFSYPIWFLLTRNYSDTDLTKREYLLKRWESNGYLGKDGRNQERLKDLYFGNGGISTIKEIENRKEMIIETLVVIDLLQQVIRGLEAELMY